MDIFVDIPEEETESLCRETRDQVSYCACVCHNILFLVDPQGRTGKSRAGWELDEGRPLTPEIIRSTVLRRSARRWPWKSCDAGAVLATSECSGGLRDFGIEDSMTGLERTIWPSKASCNGARMLSIVSGRMKLGILNCFLGSLGFCMVRGCLSQCCHLPTASA